MQTAILIMKNLLATLQYTTSKNSCEIKKARESVYSYFTFSYN